MAEIEGNLEFEMSLGTATYADCFRGDMKARSWTGILVQMFQQLSVLLLSVYGSPLTMENAGLESTSSSVGCDYISNSDEKLTLRVDYGTSFFQSAGISNPYTITVATGVVNVGMTRSSHFSLSLCSRLDGFSLAVPGIYLMERLGRRKLLIYGAIWMSACNCKSNSLRSFENIDSSALSKLSTESVWLRSNRGLGIDSFAWFELG